MHRGGYRIDPGSIRAEFSHDFWWSVHDREDSGQRLGQAVFNTACDAWPGYVDSLAGTPHDPFYRDEKIDDFLTAVLERLTNPD